MKRLLFFICTLLCANVLMAQTRFWIGDLQYEVTSTSPAEVKVNDANSSITTAIIPSTVSYEGIDYSVTSIGEDAFEFCSSLTSVTIGNSVTSIGNYAFFWCSNLTSVNIPNSVTSIGNSAFCVCSSLTSVTIGNSVTSIGEDAFNSCSSLTFITIPNSVTSIGDYAFYTCTSLTSVTIGNSVTSIGNRAFSDCSSLTSVDIPNSVTSIGDYAFYFCSGLTSVTIGNSVTSIGNYAFRDCSSLTTINFNAINCEDFAPTYPPFDDCPISTINIGGSVQRIPGYFIGSYFYLPPSSLTSITIPNSVTSIGQGAFYGCNLNSVTCLAETAPSLFSASIFYDTPSTKVLNIPCESDYSAWESATDWASVERIGCEEEECVDVFTIGDLTYEKTSATEVSVKDCDSTATEVIIPASVEQCGITYSVTSIGDNAFEGCSSLTSIDIPNGVTSIGNYAFWNCSNLTSIDIPNSVTSIGNSAFRNSSSLTSITIPNSVTSIGNSAFQSCSSLTSITIPNSVTSIGDGAFNGCSNLTSITIPNSITSIGTSTFSGCSSLTSITIPNSVTSIAGLVFSNCSSLTSITIPNSVTFIGMWAFSGCSGLDSIACLAETAPSLGSSAFSGTPSTKVLNIPCGSNYSSWESATDWASVECTLDLGNSLTYFPLTFAIISGGERTMKVSDCDESATNVEIPARVMYNGALYDVISIGDSAFRGCDDLTSVNIPNSVTSIGDYAFGGCFDLTSINIPNSVTSIGDYALGGCFDLTSINIPNSVTSIGKRAFAGSGLTSINIPNGVTTIDTATFSGCDDLTSVNIPNSVTSICYDAFCFCNGLEYVTIPNSVTSIGNYAFYCCNSLDSVTIPNSVISIGYRAFNGCSNLTSITIPNSVTSIGSETFENCSSLTSVIIPNSVTSIGYGAFKSCSGLTSVTCLAETAPSLGNNVFSSTPSTKTLTVPFGSNYSSWEEASTWQKVYYLIQEGEEKELASDFTITEVRKIKNNGVLRIKPEGQLINETSTNVSGVFEIETPTLPNDKWSFVGAPFNGYKLEAIKEGTRDVAVSVFDYDSADWSEEFATIETPIRKGEGFLLWSFAEEATVFTTNPENPSEEYTLNNGGVSVTETLTTHEGGGNWMALANPYTFKLDIAKFLQDQNDVKGRIVYRLNGVSWEEVSSGIIGLTEGFFVNYANPGSQTATFVRSHRYTGASSKAEKKKEYIKLYMNDGERTSKLSIAQNEEASQGDDIFDANKLFSPFEIAEPYFLTEGVALVKEEVKTLPYTATLNVKSYESKEVTFSVGDIPEDYNVYLIDNGFDIKMNDGVEYNTRIVAGENADRFKFVIKKAHRLTETVNKDIYVNNFNREVRISSTQKDLKIEVYDALGRKVFETKDYKFELNQVPAGAYMVKVYNRFARKDAKIVLN